jgi:hypothetical protein
MNFSRKMLIGSFAGALAFSLGIASPVNAETTKMVVIHEAPVIKHNEEVVEIGKTGSILYFEAAVRTKSGKRIGLLSGQTSVIDVSRGGEAEVVRYRELVFAFNGGQIVALGTAIYAAQGTLNFRNDNAPVTIAVVGGTGKYRSAKGEVVTTIRADGSYREVIILDK